MTDAVAALGGLRTLFGRPVDRSTRRRVA